MGVVGLVCVDLVVYCLSCIFLFVDLKFYVLLGVFQNGFFWQVVGIVDCLEVDFGVFFCYIEYYVILLVCVWFNFELLFQFFIIIDMQLVFGWFDFGWYIGFGYDFGWLGGICFFEMQCIVQ